MGDKEIWEVTEDNKKKSPKDKQKSFFEKAQELDSLLVHSQDKIDQLFMKQNLDPEVSKAKISEITEVPIIEKPVEKEVRHIIFELIPEDMCLDILKYLEKNYSGCSINHLSSAFSIEIEEMTDNIEVLLNYGLVFETVKQKEKVYMRNDGEYIKFMQELKRK